MKRSWPGPRDGARKVALRPEHHLVVTERDGAVYRRVRRFYAELDVRRIASEAGVELDDAAFEEAVSRYDRW